MSEKILKQIYAGKGGALGKYRALHTGKGGAGYFLFYEFCMLLFRNMPGLLGLAARAFLYRALFGAMGRGVAIGAGVTLRNPLNIFLGDSVVLDDLSLVDAKGGGNRGVRLGSRVFISRNVMLACKDGGITIGDDVSIGPGSHLNSVGGATITIGSHVMIASNCQIVACGNYRHERTDVPMAEQGLEDGKGITIGGDVWIGANCFISDGARIGDGSIIGACSMVRGAIPPYSVAFGAPATVKKSRVNAGEAGS